MTTENIIKLLVPTNFFIGDAQRCNKVFAVATMSDDTHRLIFRSSEKDDNGKFGWCVQGIDEDAFYVEPIDDARFFKAKSIRRIVRKYSDEHLDSIDMMGSNNVPYIKTIDTCKGAHIEYDADGIGTASRFDSLEKYQEIISELDWNIPVGSTSNCSTHYSIGGVAETTTGDIISIITGNFSGYFSMTPCRTYADGVAEGNYGTPTLGNDIRHCLDKFNKDVFDSQKYGCRLGQITRVLLKDGGELTPTIFE